MIIAISGTPCTGKTETAERLAEAMNANLVSLSELLKKRKIKYVQDNKRKTKIVSVNEIKRAVKKEITKSKTNIIEGHLSHLLSSDFVIILRTRPDVLEKRMEKRRWRKEKIVENIQAEILDAITIEAMQNHRKVMEIDTTEKTAKQTAALIKKLLNNFALQKRYRPGKTDWSERYSRYLINYEG